MNLEHTNISQILNIKYCQSFTFSNALFNVACMRKFWTTELNSHQPTPFMGYYCCLDYMQYVFVPQTLYRHIHANQETTRLTLEIFKVSWCSEFHTESSISTGCAWLKGSQGLYLLPSRTSIPFRQIFWLPTLSCWFFSCVRQIMVMSMCMFTSSPFKECLSFCDPYSC